MENCAFFIRFFSFACVFVRLKFVESCYELPIRGDLEKFSTKTHSDTLVRIPADGGELWSSTCSYSRLRYHQGNSKRNDNCASDPILQTAFAARLVLDEVSLCVFKFFFGK